MHLIDVVQIYYVSLLTSSKQRRMLLNWLFTQHAMDVVLEFCSLKVVLAQSHLTQSLEIVV